MKFLTTILLLITLSVSADIVIYPNGISTNSVPNCQGGQAAGSATYARTLANGWGWAPNTNGNTVFTATYTNTANVNVQSVGKSGDTLCGTSNSIEIVSPPYSPKYRWTVYFHSVADIPSSTNGAPLVLHNFNP